MNIAFIYGFFSSQTRGPYDVQNLDSHDLSGSESFFFNMLRQMSKRPNLSITAFGYWKTDCKFDGIEYKKLTNDSNPFPGETKSSLSRFDHAIVWNEPDYLALFPEHTQKICVQQLNDFSYCRSNYLDNTDLFLFPSKAHKEHMLKTVPFLARKDCAVLSNCLNATGWITRDQMAQPRKQNLVYCSSPDRGLHWVADIFPDIKKRVPGVTLSIFYRYDSWYENFKDVFVPGNSTYHELGMRARYINEFFDRFGRNGENGVTLHGAVPSSRIAKELSESKILLYPCDTVVFTEGFGVSILDACYAGCVPVISDTDALGSVYSVLGPLPHPKQNREVYISRVCMLLTDQDEFNFVQSKARSFSEQFTVKNQEEDLFSYLDN